MARIILPLTPLVARKLLSLNGQIIQAQHDAARLKAIVDQITNNGNAATNLEGAGTECCAPAGTGAVIYAVIYAGIGQIKTALDGLAALVSVIDQG